MRFFLIRSDLKIEVKDMDLKMLWAAVIAVSSSHTWADKSQTADYQLHAHGCCGRLITKTLKNALMTNCGLQLMLREKLVWECDELQVYFGRSPNNPKQRKPSLPSIPPFTTRFLFDAFKKQSCNKAVSDPVVHFPPHLHGHTPALHGREPVAHVAVAAIGRSLVCVRLRQISPHGCRFLWL